MYKVPFELIWPPNSANEGKPNTIPKIIDLRTQISESVVPNEGITDTTQKFIGLRTQISESVVTNRGITDTTPKIIDLRTQICESVGFFTHNNNRFLSDNARYDR